MRESVVTLRRVRMGAHPDTMTSIASLAGLLHAQGRLDDSEALYREALAGRQTALGEGHAYTQRAAANLEVVLRAKAAQRGARDSRA